LLEVFLTLIFKKSNFFGRKIHGIAIRVSFGSAHLSKQLKVILFAGHLL
jgi:hypothetical protein